MAWNAADRSWDEVYRAAQSFKVRKQVLKPQDIDKAYPPRKMSVEPWRMEFAALVSLWQPLLPFGLVTPSDLLTPADDIHEYTVKFPPFFHHESSHVPHFMLVFWNQ
ncbi:hypothetical protein PG996_013509 [Apiospora saccharicola]|uniref:Uncharacterized protein n=1 Tax=Apiospora saccharicola TaxID=335842 RepID=A0ABR1U5N3_9PEZI